MYTQILCEKFYHQELAITCNDDLLHISNITNADFLHAIELHIIEFQHNSTAIIKCHNILGQTVQGRLCKVKFVKLHIFCNNTASKTTGNYKCHYLLPEAEYIQEQIYLTVKFFLGYFSLQSQLKTVFLQNITELSACR